MTIPAISASISATIARVTISACGTAYYAGPRRQILDRALRAPARRDRCRLRDPLPRAAAAAGRAGAVRLAVGRDGRHAGDAALLPRRRASASPPSSTCAPPPSRANPTRCCRRWPAPRSASPRPRPSRASWRCSPASPSRSAARAARSTREQERELVTGADRGAAPHLARCCATRASSRRWRTMLSKAARRALSRPRHRATRIALEGALKLKEISYIHAEGYAAGELKHGPIALIDENVPVIVVAPRGRPLREDGLQHAGGRGARRPDHPDLGRGAREGRLQARCPHRRCRRRPRSPIRCIYAVPVQLLAYHTAVIMGTDVDQPRNLAKSVTVE